MPRGRFERWSWQIHVVAFLSQCSQFQWLTAFVALIPPAKRVKILHLSTPPVHAGVAASCPCGRTLRSCIDVFPCGTAVRGWWTGVFVLVVPALWHTCVMTVSVSTLLAGQCHFRGCLRSYVLMRRLRFRTFAFQREFRPS